MVLLSQLCASVDSCVRIPRLCTPILVVVYFHDDVAGIAVFLGDGTSVYHTSRDM
jgi:hypothetical protein